MATAASIPPFDHGRNGAASGQHGELVNEGLGARDLPRPECAAPSRPGAPIKRADVGVGTRTVLCAIPEKRHAGGPSVSGNTIRDSAPSSIPPAEVLALAERQRAAGRITEAEALCRQVLAAHPDEPNAFHLLGLIAYQSGALGEAIERITRAVALAPGVPLFRVNLGEMCRLAGRTDEAIAHARHALELKSANPGALNNLGIALYERQNYQEALDCHERALALAPDFALAHSNRGNALHALRRYGEAEAAYRRALALEAGMVQVWNNLGTTLRELGRPQEAAEAYRTALAHAPDHPGLLDNLALALKDLERPAEAADLLARALAIDDRDSKLHLHLGAVLIDQGKPEAAIAALKRALALDPASFEANNLMGRLAFERGAFDEALAYYDRELALTPDSSDTLANRGSVLKELKRFAAAAASFERALTIEPQHAAAWGGLADCALRTCDWARTAAIAGKLATHIAERGSYIEPFMMLACSDDPSLQLACARNHVRAKFPAAPKPLWNRAIRRHPKIRLAYLSAGFHRHPVAHLTSELFELHDRTRFEVLAISCGPDDGSDERARLKRAFDQFHDVRALTDRDAAALIHDLEVDILIDRTGHQKDARLGILARRAAPIQVSYLGFAGTMGADFIDYIIADPVVLPFHQQPFIAENIVHLPDCYQVNDSGRRIATRTPARHELGLPEQGFVFCCFNNNYKITAPVFDVWMRLLGATEGSVLWLLQDNDTAESNLRQEAAARGIDPGRLVFATRQPLPDHLARHRTADLFLDTSPFNAHTTGSDALWAGLPLVTCAGATFAGRVGASLLTAIGLPELVTHSLDDYEALALRLATDPPLLVELRERLAQNQRRFPLFDTSRYRRQIEAAYSTMWEIWQRGERPRSFSIDPR
jgi:protein O-GlcNAc transferase